MTEFQFSKRKATFEDLSDMKDPILDDNFDLFAIDFLITPTSIDKDTFDKISIATSSFDYTVFGDAVQEAEGFKGCLSIDVLNTVSGQTWIDACAALVTDIKTMTFRVFKNDGSVYSTIKFLNLQQPQMTTGFKGAGGNIQMLKYTWKFEHYTQKVA